MRKTRSCGVILFKDEPRREFLLMKHAHRLDLPKGHVDPGETDLECALREMWEETGIAKDSVRIDPDFRFEEIYYPVEARFNHEKVEKTLVIFLGWLDRDWPIVTTEHAGYEWRVWQPPHQLQKYTIDPLLAALERYFQARTGGT